ncbi:MAG: MMPL family transporter [Bowdeniella nasicola]|nr:MMPL family transporter [Bowdeniella nasicola]
MAIAFAFTPLFGKPLFSLLESGLPSIPNTDSRRVADYLGEEEDQAETIFLVVTNTPIPKADSPADSALVKLREDIERVDADIEILDAPTFAHAIDEIDTAIADGKAEVDAQLRQAREEALAQLEAQFAPAQAQIDQLVQRDPARALAAQAQLDAEKAAASAKVEAQLAEASTRAEAELEAELAEVRAQRSDAAQALSRFTPTESEGYVLLAQLPSDRPENETEQIHRDVVTLMQRAGTDIAGAENATVFSQPLLLDSMIEQVQADLVTGEAVGVPIALILMVLIFGGLIAAGLPLAGAITSIVIGLGGLWVLTSFTAVDSFIVNVISIIGLGLSIDYGLLVVSRYREEVQNRLESAGFDPFGADLPRHLKASERSKIHAVIAEAIAATVATSGRTVFFSGLTIACSLAGLLAMQASLLRVIAVAGLFVVLLAVATAVTLVPALISLLGTILLRPSILTRIPVLARVNDKLSDRSSERGVFSAIARFVHRRPWPILLVVVAILGILAAPISQMNLRFYIGDNLPQGTQVREAYLTLHDEYVALTGADMQILADAPLATVEESGYVRDLRNRYGSDAVVVSAREGESQSLINVRTGFADPVSHDAIDQMLDQRAHQADFDTWVGGAAGLNYDFNEQLADGFPFALSVVIAAVFILMFMMTGSLLVPLKAAIINAFSLIASLGATVWIFQGGHFGMEQVPGLEAYVVAMVLAFGFGLAMDYEVFLLARIKEYWDGGAANDHAVELGLQKSGRIITSAAVIIIAVFFGFVFGDMRAIKQTGIALAMTVAVDATLVRMLLVPATMTLLGQWNWWAPKPLARLYTRFGISEG